ncbi:hypothetical protein WS67_16770 [Burkholderia singularis]|uniref:Uncharacterized protein n=1 Tax=Burkholderia singularis TaxID=1503053 RepID=A0A103E0E1_9BURK|nr:hypothetical protein [Burkholderia singularis]KVE26027.1 hypothetical protein WS67_16770 [Burkholderia singularis]
MLYDRMLVGVHGELRELHRQSIRSEGIEVPIGKRKAGEQQRVKLVLWSPELKTVVDEAVALQRTSSVHVFGNTVARCTRAAARIRTGRA